MSPLASKTAEFIPGYVLHERIGAGGYGEVWKVEAPGGLLKAIKLVYGCLDEERASREMKALTRIREVRHPFILSLERIEVLDGQLVVVTELADGSLRDRYEQCRAEGKPGIPRDELLGHLRDAADALDYMSERHSLQHLDVKPENLLLVGGRVKVADFGLVKDVQDQTVSLIGGLTPVYAAPEVFDAHPSLRSDQYSLAIVYEELLSGVLPFPGRTPSQLAAQHLHSKPRLSHLPPHDRSVLARALAKDPAQRFPNCRALIDALFEESRPLHGPLCGTVDAAGGAAGRDTDPAAASSERTVAPLHERARAASPRGQSVSSLCTVPLEGPGALLWQDLDAARAGRGAAQADDLAHWPLQTTAAEPVREDLPPLQAAADEAGLRPVLVVGIGGAAARALRQLRRRWSDRFGEADSMPAFQVLLVDTDPGTIAEATSGDPDEALDRDQTLLAPLRRPEEYRDALEEHSRWLSRRWLCNLPHSQRTEGLRPLGRLAFVDHAGEIRKRLLAALTRITSTVALASAERSAGPLRSRAPSVVVVASVSGGTGSGMVLDLTYAIRDVLSGLPFAETDLWGILLHGTPRHPSEKMLAALNACACLRELQYYTIAGYPGEPLCGLPAFGAGIAPFDDTYLVHLGNELSEADFDQATGDVAGYLDLATASPAGGFLEKCRADGRRDDSPATELTVRSFGVGRFGCSPREIASAAADLICRGAAEHWRGGREANPPAPGSGPAVVEAPSKDDTLDQVLQWVRGAIDAELGGSAEGIVIETTRSALAQPGADGPRAGAEAATRAVDACLARLRSPETGRPGVAAAARDAPFLKRIEDMAAARAASLGEECLHRLAEPGTRATDAVAAAQSLVERIYALKNEAAERRERQQKHLAEAAQEIAEGSAQGHTRPRRWLWIGGRKKAEDGDVWTRYARLRVEREVLDGAARFLRSLEPKLAAAARLARSFAGELEALAGAFLADAPAPGDLAAMALAVVRDRLLGLIGEFDSQWRAELLAAPDGPLADASGADRWRRDAIARWRRTVRKRILKVFREDGAGWSPALVDQAQAGQNAVPNRVQSGMPRLGSGGRRRGFVTCPAELTSQTIQAAAQAAGLSSSVVVDPAGDSVFCCEVEGLALSWAAARLIDNRPDYAQIAARLHTRLDVPW